MRPIVFGESVQGSSHKRVGIGCQDNKSGCKFEDGTIILSIADGHGSKSCPYSKTGSQIAVNVFVKVLEKFYDSYTGNLESLLTFLNREGDTKVAQAIDAEWKRRVLKAHTNNKYEVPRNEEGEKNKAEIYALYGTTLIGLMVTPLFLFAFQLGDGDVIHVDSEGVSHIISSDRILGVETHSLCRLDSWKRTITCVRRMEEEKTRPFMFMLSTDGFANSYKNEQEFSITCVDYFHMIREHGACTVRDNLKDWLSETSEMGCGDDITLYIAYYPDNSSDETTAPHESEVSTNDPDE